MIIRVFVVTFFLLTLSGITFSEEHDRGSKQVFSLHSYNLHYPWTLAQQEGFLERLNERLGAPIVLSTEHLDTKRVEFNDTYKSFFKAYLEKKYSTYTPDLIYVTDDNALDFTLSFLPEHFNAVPVVFSGVNDIDFINSLDKQRFTGVYEHKEVPPNLELLRAIDPEIKNLTVLGDGSSTYKPIKNDLTSYFANHKSLNVSFIEEDDIDAISSQLGSLQSKYVLLTTIGSIRASNGDALTLKQIIGRIVDSSDRIIISMEDSYLYDGVLGGYVTNGRQQGTLAAELATRLLHGEDITQLGTITNGTSTYIFDELLLKKFGIHLPTKIMDEAIFFNQSASWYEQNRQTITTLLILLSLISFLLLCSFLLMLYRKNHLILLSNQIIAEKEKLEFDRLQKVEQYKEALVELSKEDVTSISEAFNHACRISSETLDVKRVSVWMCSEGRHSIVNSAQYVLNEGKAETGAELKRSDFPIYFEGMDSGRLLVIDDVFNNPITSELTEVYLRPNNITSMLDVPILYQGECMGVVCHEHIGPKRSWTLDEQEFALAVAKTISLSLEISKRKEIEKVLEHHAYHDSLTNLPNRDLLTDRLNQAILQASRNNKKIAVLFMDLDHFKNVNDSLGHSVGDKLLVEVSKILRNQVRQSDTIARIGGDEFVLVVHPFDSVDQVTDLATSISRALQKPIAMESIELATNASIGISIYPDDGQDSETLIKNADAAMYHAKKQGRNTFHFFNQEMTDRAVKRIELESRIRKAIENQEFIAYFQPQYDLKTKSLIGCEALARWQTADQGILSPFHFISVAEEVGLIIHIDRLIMKNAITSYKKWLDKGWKLGVLSVNLSMRQLSQKDFYKEVKELLEALDFDPHHLNFEITESYIMNDPEGAISLLEKLKDMGIGIAIDDFGTGYSSLEYLKRLPVSKLKIDKSFVSDVLVDQGDAAIVKAVIALAHSLNLDVIAEGVEEHAQADFLLTHQCAEVQGFLYSTPISASELEESYESLVTKLT